MAKPTGALLSFSASGTIAKTAVFASWRGRQYVRRHVVPHNPRSAAQTETRSAFTWLMFEWKQSPADFQAPWTAAAKGRPVTNRNLFAKANISVLRLASDLTDFTFSNGAGGGLAPDTATFTPGTTDIVAAGTIANLPVGWSIVEAVAAALRDVDPTGLDYPTMVVGTDNTSPYSITLSGLETGTLYRTALWFVFMKPDGSLAYGIAQNGSATPT